MKLILPLVAAVALSTPALAQELPASILQLFSYKLADATRFREGYRAHLQWHARQSDRLVWYGWSVQAGPRRGLFIDGTAGASLAALDARPDLAGDAADFVATVGASAQPVDIETWAWWPGPSTASTLEDRKPSATMDVLLMKAPEGRVRDFEATLQRLAQKRRAESPSISWYRRLRGGGEANYMLVLPRRTWAEIATTGGTFRDILAKAYRGSDREIDTVLAAVDVIAVETWAYEPRLSLIPGEALAP